MGLQGWQGNNYTEGLTATAEGLAFRSTGIDPWIEGPAVDLPGEGTVRVRVRMKSEADTGGELFYGRTFQAGHSVRFTVNNDGQWHDYFLVIPERLGPGTRFRLDPATSEGQIVIASIEVEVLAPVQPPQWEKPVRPRKGDAEPVSVTLRGFGRSSTIGQGWGGFVVKVDGQEMAAGYQAEQIGRSSTISRNGSILSKARILVHDRQDSVFPVRRPERQRRGEVAGDAAVQAGASRRVDRC